MNRKPITPAELKREYKRCIAREKDRYREWDAAKHRYWDNLKKLQILFKAQ